jgi:hypothetical protein
VPRPKPVNLPAHNFSSRRTRRLHEEQAQQGEKIALAYALSIFLILQIHFIFFVLWFVEVNSFVMRRAQPGQGAFGWSPHAAQSRMRPP